MSEESRGVSRWLTLRAKRRPNKPALVTPWGSRSFALLDENANRLANALTAAGLDPGERVLLLCGNRPEFAEAMIAGERAGVCLIPLVYDLKPPELRHVIFDAAARACIVDDALDHSLVAVLDVTSTMKLRLIIGGTLEGFEPYAARLAAASATPPPNRPRGYAIYYTSGTTGRPKGVIGSRPDLLALIEPLSRIHAFRQDGDAFLCPFPLFHPHMFNLGVAMPLSAGVTTHLLPTLEPMAILETIAREKITHAYLSAYVFHLMRELGEDGLARHDLSSLRVVLHGAAPCPVDLKHWILRQLGPIVAEYYGASEGGGACITAEEWLRKPGSVGNPPASLDVRIVGTAGETCAAGIPGHVYFRAAPELRFDYLGDPAKTAAAYRGEHFTVRDIGYLDEDGYLFLIGRDADVANIAGYNVYPEEIDQVLAEHPAVAEALSFSAPAEGKGERIVSLVRLHSGRNADAALHRDLIDHCRRNLARHKWPSSIEFSELLPRSAIGKKQRYRAREDFLKRDAACPAPQEMFLPRRRNELDGTGEIKDEGHVRDSTKMETKPLAGLGFQDGLYVPLNELKVSVLDFGFIHCDATYDVFHVVDRAAFLLEKHLDRFFQSAEKLRLTVPYSRAALRSLLLDIVARSELSDAFVWMCVTRGVPLSGRPRDMSGCSPRFFAYAKPYYGFMAKPQAVSVCLARSARRSGDDSIDPRWKNFAWIDLSRAQLEAVDRGFDTALLLDLTNAISEGPGFNVCMVKDNALSTPDRNCLSGVTIAAIEVLAKRAGLPFVRRRVEKAELMSADEIFLTSTSGGVIPVAQIDERALSPGELTEVLSAEYWRLHRDPEFITEIPSPKNPDA